VIAETKTSRPRAGSSVERAQRHLRLVIAVRIEQRWIEIEPARDVLDGLHGGAL
jgi:hypothetical protein